MELYSWTEHYKLYHWNMLDLLQVIEPNTIDSIVTDPPYELNFMWKWWDNSWIAFNPDTWKKCLEVLKPWWYLLAFWGSRTYHRIACAIEDAGFEIRDCIMWLYGSWFPKSMNLWKGIESKLLNWTANPKDFKNLEWEKHNVTCWFNATWKETWYRDKEYEMTKIDVEYKTELWERYKWWGTALKPSYEPIIVARKPLEWSCTDNVIKYGVWGINIDECRVGTETISIHNAPAWTFAGWEYDRGSDTESYRDSVWRFPANTILTYWEDDKEEVCSGFPNTAPSKRVEWWANRKSYNQKEVVNPSWWKEVNRIRKTEWYDDNWGSAARYFYCAKASKRDRDEWLDEFEESNAMCDRNPELKSANMPQNRSWNMRKNTHPTVKPTDLMQYLVRLVTPNGWTVLDPFNWSGSTWKAVMYENKDRNKNYKYIWIELTDEYLPIAKARIEYAINVVEEKQEEQKQPTLFDL
jgi:site-specific DNA-methyltransferase (adenine-specific)